ncbi:hypothetical protein [Desulfobaculum bizertense]|uniref:Uncharacterized protein n=1 Tax=Desulfobaculum bizertense DSM 18034 TaxID=1121442 RepID=A0A1T4VYV3_9BACT|nr:hypothetical protein [Desulfobaculum bizertense]UIJ37007.1 hypothetical protein LWC08_09675 [Desulfobaculum bizertense]SKA70166.1 hypothetical protein SAMN02745702_01293 [Desulfobaculum bizertense DSM 18034]
MKIEFGKADVPGLLLSLFWLITFFVLVSLVTGSYAEYEPISGFRYGIVTVLWALTGPVLRLWWKKRKQA